MSDPANIRTVADLLSSIQEASTANGTNRQFFRDLLVSLDNEVATETAARTAADSLRLLLTGGTLTGPIVVQGITVGLGNGATDGNLAVGKTALAAATALGIANTAIGFQALAACLDAAGNTAVGYQAMNGAVTGNGANTTVGYQSAGHTTGTQNASVGYWALRSTTTGSNNAALGYRAGMSVVSAQYGTYIGYATFDAACGDFNTGVGGFAGTTSTGTRNTVGGYFSFKSSMSGDTNTAWGASSLLNNVSGSGNVALGNFAGAYELGSNAFYVDNQDRTNTAGDKARALLYGTFSATAASQTLAINAGTVTVLGTIGGVTTLTAASGTTSASGLFSSSGAGTAGTLALTDTGGLGCNFRLTGDGATTPKKYIRAKSGNMEWVNDAYTVVIATLSDAGQFTAKRLRTNGTTLVAGDFALSAGWGTTAAVGTITGNDAAWQMTVTSSGTGQGANPTITLTFHDGTWTNAPITVSKMVGGTGTVTLLTETPTATTNVITFQGTPVAGSTYIISSHAIGR